MGKIDIQAYGNTYHVDQVTLASPDISIPNPDISIPNPES